MMPRGNGAQRPPYHRQGQPIRYVFSKTFQSPGQPLNPQSGGRGFPRAPIPENGYPFYQDVHQARMMSPPNVPKPASPHKGSPPPVAAKYNELVTSFAPPKLQAEDGNVMNMKMLECPCCMNCCDPPIVQCANGHNICPNCRPILTNCPTCRGEFTNTRNRFAEAMSTTKYPCSHQKKGCKESFLLKDLETHLDSCVHGIVQVKCHLKQRPSKDQPFVPCEWQGEAICLASHVEYDHVGFFKEGSETSDKFKLRKHHALLISAYDELFWAVLKYDPNPTVCEMRVTVFSVSAFKKPVQYTFKFVFRSHDESLSISKRGVVSIEGEPIARSNNTAFCGKRVIDQLVQDDLLSFQLKIVENDEAVKQLKNLQIS